MKVLIIGGNRFVGLRLSHALAQDGNIELSIVNRTGQVAHAANAAVYKADRSNLKHSHLDRDWDAIVDFAAFNDKDVSASLDYFKNVKRYVFISTVAVYDFGAALSESAFDAGSYDLSRKSREGGLEGYQDGKRRAEAEFTRHAPFPTLSVRFPFILGPDDYTRRLEFHVDRVLNGQPIYMPNPEARVSMIHSEDACRFLQWSLQQNIIGALNVASPEPIALRELLARTERITGRKALLVKHATQENSSPYGVPADWSVDTVRLKQLGFTARPIKEWIEDLIEGASGIKPAPSRLH